MHELSLCDAIVATADRHAAGRPIRRIQLRIGHLRQVVPATLEFCWEARVDDTDLESCKLVVEYVPVMLRCRTCAADTTLSEPALRCGSCGGRAVDVLGGDEFLIESIDVVRSDEPAEVT